MSTIHDERYVKLISGLKEIRKSKGITQQQLAKQLSQPQSYIAKVEQLERRLDLIELFDWLNALNVGMLGFLHSSGFLNETELSTSIPALPIPGKVTSTHNGISLSLAWQGKEVSIILEGITSRQYLKIERDITRIYRSLNEKTNSIKNREVICEALELAVLNLPNLNPSDIYQHIVYRLYLREYKKTQADRSWVRAGGEALELFVQRHYSHTLNSHGILIKSLLSNNDEIQALKDMNIHGQVGDSKLDVALYGKYKSKRYAFGGIHVKASLAERVSDDVPCSQAMMSKGYISLLFTFDSKSFPPPHGDLVNRGELGTPQSPSDKRKYIEEQGLFDGCFSYNLRTFPSLESTASGKKIYVSSFEEGKDPLPDKIMEAWESFKRARLTS